MLCSRQLIDKLDTFLMRTEIVRHSTLFLPDECMYLWCMPAITCAFNDGRLLHDARAGQRHEESHSDSGDYLKAVVFGGLDGILTSFAIVAGAAGEAGPLFFCVTHE